MGAGASRPSRLGHAQLIGCRWQPMPRNRLHAALTFAKGTSRMISSVAPLLEKHTSRSWGPMMPMSPCCGACHVGVGVGWGWGRRSTR